MTEHESNLLDLYAGMAMLGMVTKGHYHDIAKPAWEIAEEMLKRRKERANEKQNEEGAIPDMAVPDMEGREDSDTQGIAALKKTKTRSKPS